MKRINALKNRPLRTVIVRVIDKRAKAKILSYVYKYRHFENILLILIKQNYNLYKEGKDVNDFKYLTDYSIMRAVLRDTSGGKRHKEVQYIKGKYRNNKLMQSLIEISKDLKIHNLSMIISRVKANYETFFTNLKIDKTARPPKAKKLSKLIRYTIPLDKVSFSIKEKNIKRSVIGINLSNKMFYLHINYSDLLSVVEDIKNIQSVSIHFSNSDVYLNISYFKGLDKRKTKEETKEAGIDIGIRNIAAVFVSDEETPSLVVSGNRMIKYNAKFNRFLSKLNTSIVNEAVEWRTLRNGTRYPIEYTDRGKALIRFRTFLFEKRNRFFFNEFHKASRMIVKYLKQHNVTDLYVSNNLAEEKNNGKNKLNKTVKQTFIQIPIVQFLKDIQYKAEEYNIKVHVINEAYTSKASCISDNVQTLQRNPLLTNGLNGSRVKRGLFKDKRINKVFNADVNGAVNHIKVGTNKSFEWLKNYLFKLANPVKIKSSYEFSILLNSRMGKGRLTPSVASYRNL